MILLRPSDTWDETLTGHMNDGLAIACESTAIRHIIYKGSHTHEPVC